MQIRKLIVSSFERRSDMIHTRIQEFLSGGGGDQVHLAYKKAVTTFFLFFFSTYFIEVQWLLSKKTIICQGSTGAIHFPGGGGGPTFYRGFNCFFPYNL